MKNLSMNYLLITNWKTAFEAEKTGRPYLDIWFKLRWSVVAHTKIIHFLM